MSSDVRQFTTWRLADLPKLPSCVRGGHLLIGHFDGVHLGHRKMIDRASALAREHGGPVVAMTFEPHPQTVLCPGSGFNRLTELGEKVRLLMGAGVERVIAVNFDNDMASLSGETVALDVLSRCFEAKSIVIGRDFRFGESSDISGAQFAAIEARPGSSVEIIPPARVPGGHEDLTSDYLKSRLAAGDVKGLNRLLGRRWAIDGIVVHGDKRGRELGFPTVNLAFRNDIRLGLGIYAVRLLINGRIENGVASYGTRPQFDNGAPRLEVHILDFAGDLYGAHLLVEFVAFQRHERVFSDMGALLRQMQVDCQEARRFLADGFCDPSIESVLVRSAQLDERSFAQR